MQCNWINYSPRRCRRQRNSEKSLSTGKSNQVVFFWEVEIVLRFNEEFRSRYFRWNWHRCRGKMKMSKGTQPHVILHWGLRVNVIIYTISWDYYRLFCLKVVVGERKFSYEGDFLNAILIDGTNYKLCAWGCCKLVNAFISSANINFIIDFHSKSLNQCIFHLLPSSILVIWTSLTGCLFMIYSYYKKISLIILTFQFWRLNTNWTIKFSQWHPEIFFKTFFGNRLIWIKRLENCIIIEEKSSIFN